MLRHTAAIFICLLALVYAAADLCAARANAQDKKPSQALRQVLERQEKLLTQFDRDVGAGRAQAHEWDARTEALRRLAGERVTAFKLADWQSAELLALATLYQWAELFPQAVEAYRAYISAAPKGRARSEAAIALARALLESGQVEEAAKMLDEMFSAPPETQLQFISGLGLYRELALLWRERGQYDIALKLALRGYELSEQAEAEFALTPNLRETRDREQLSLAAIIVALQERRGDSKEADEFKRKLAARQPNQPASLRSFYEAELAAARLIGHPAPELVIARWLDSAPKPLTELRGKVVLLDFWAMWCGPWIAAFPYFRELQSKYESQGLNLIGVTRFYGRSDNEDELGREQEWKSLQNYKSRHQLRYPFAVGKMDDVTNEERYGVAGVPTVFLIDRRGNVRHVKRGVGDYRKLERQIKRLLDEQ